MRPAAVILVVLLCACPKDEPAPFGDDDRTIQKLKAEKARLEKSGEPQPPTPSTKAPEPDPLTEAAVKREPPQTIALPSTTPVQAGDVTFTPKKLETMQTVAGPKMSLSTADRFFKVTLSAVAPKKETPLELSSAQLVEGDRKFAVARDVQRLGGGTALSATVGTEPHDVVIFFEAPADALKKGLKLVLPAGSGSVDVTLQ